jgi:predicted GTPase
MNYKTQKQNLLNRIEKLFQFSEEIDENIKSHLLSLKEEIKNELQFNVLCTGEFSAGKSTFINRFFIKKDVLPTKATETTAKLTFIKYKEDEKIVIHYLDGTSDVINEVSEGILENYLAKDGKKINLVDYAEIFINSDVLKEGVAIIDSPGLNAPENERINLTNEFVPKADAVLYLMSALQAWKGTEKEFLENKILNKDDLDKIFFLLNYWDVLDESEGDDVLNFVKKEMHKSLEVAKRDLGEVSTPPIIPISAKTKFNFDKLDKDLIDYLSSKKGYDILNQKIEKFESIKQKILKYLDNKNSLCEEDKEKLEEELKNIQNELDELKKEANEYKKNLYPKVDKIVEKWISKIEDLYKEFTHNVIYKVEKKEIKKLEELDSELKKIIFNQSHSLQKRLNSINKIFFREIEELAEEEKAKLNLEEYFIKKESGNIYDLEKEIKTEVKENKVYNLIPELTTVVSVGSGLIPLFIGLSSTAVLFLSLPILGGGTYLYFQKQKEMIEKNKSFVGDTISDFIDEKINELDTKKDEVINNIIDNIENEIVKSYEIKFKEYQNISNTNKTEEIEKNNKLKMEIEKI